MRLSVYQQEHIKRQAKELFGESVTVTVFGSRIDDHVKGGDLDLLISTSEHIEHPAWKAARLSARLSRMMGGRNVDVVVQSPTLKRLPIHQEAHDTGVTL
ncbi:nucleotidyltransferase domain-containing protein [Aidingimonas halophila]|uniref:Nucleotidyltransferase domain-containing protein n=1 Tax=Aidingimonas halophila TaxID=574349 RepID=A0A1H3CMH6_9GAMM|nr:nucleotidyltransferase domain-containing protein [Aidingimonas halophila]GHC35291.1 hypothetical protein GCM10008094_30540 [Aidingimonas halophila]SDX54794.1 Nucleotidyltransferase domain-containing protein [Aidingimonas halophila]